MKTNKFTTIKKLLFVGCLAVAFAFFPTQETTKKKPQNTQAEALINATAWVQNSGEFAALNLQAYQFAKLRLTQIITQEPSEKPRAIVLDIDETVLDNSNYQAFCIKNAKDFSLEDWEKWTELARAEPIPGALDFLNFTKNNGVEIFYLSNRHENERVQTLENLKNQNFPFADNEHLVLRTDEPSKENRRQKIAEKFNIVLFFGDNLGDFSDIYYHNQDGKTAREKVLEQPELFGTKFIVLPNPMYGSWESAIYKNNNDKNLTKSQKKIQSLRSFEPK